jgi:hypothetical protein
MGDTSALRLRIFDGSRQMFSKPANFLVKIVDGLRGGRRGFRSLLRCIRLRKVCLAAACLCACP